VNTQTKSHLLVFSVYRRPRSRRVNTTPLRDVPRPARLRSARRHGAGPLERKASASRPAQPATAGSQTSGADPSRRPAVPLITSDWLENRGAAQHDDHSHRSQA